MKNEKVWVAKCSEHLGDLFRNYELSPRFSFMVQ